MTEVRTFPTLAVVSAVHGVLLCPLGDVYNVLSFLVGRSVFTHELPEAGRVSAPYVFAEHPALAAVDVSGINPENWQAEAAKIESRLGATVELHPVGWNTLADKSPVETAIEMVGEDRVVVVNLPESPEQGQP